MSTDKNKLYSLVDIEPEMAEYLDFINDADIMGQSIITPSRIEKNYDKIGEYLNNLIIYPDIFVDLMTPKDSHFKLDIDQRVVLRSFARFKQNYFVATRGASKSFLAFLSRYLTAMCVPGHKTFVCADVKSQARDIADQTVVGDLWVKFPMLKNEMKKKKIAGKIRSPYRNSADAVQFNFTGGGAFDVVGIDSARGKRRHSGIIEEMIEQDATKLNEKIIPLMNISRRTLNQRLNPNEPHAAQIYITSSGFTGTFAYEKFIESICMTAIDPKHYNVITYDWKIPVEFNRLSKHIIRNAITSTTFTQSSFDREYGSMWSSDITGAAFKGDIFKRIRKVTKADKRNYATGEDFYIVVADMAKDGNADTAVMVIKVEPREFNFLYKQVNAFVIGTTDYKVVADVLKETSMTYDTRLLIYDANGIGAAIRDWLNRDSTNAEGKFLPGIGIINPPKETVKDLTIYPKSQTYAYEVKANVDFNNKMNNVLFSRINTGAVKLLIPSATAIEKLKKQPNFLKKSHKEQQLYLQPYFFTDIVEKQLKNLDIMDIKDAGAASVLRVKQRKKGIQKDFYSCLGYGIYVVNLLYEIGHYKKHKKASKIDAFMVS